MTRSHDDCSGLFFWFFFLQRVVLLVGPCLPGVFCMLSFMPRSGDERHAWLVGLNCVRLLLSAVRRLQRAALVLRFFFF